MSFLPWAARLAVPLMMFLSLFQIIVIVVNLGFGDFITLFFPVVFLISRLLTTL